MLMYSILILFHIFRSPIPNSILVLLMHCFLPILTENFLFLEVNWHVEISAFLASTTCPSHILKFVKTKCSITVSLLDQLTIPQRLVTELFINLPFSYSIFIVKKMKHPTFHNKIYIKCKNIENRFIAWKVGLVIWY